ncbi:CLUMA_CG006631, isoform A [Clunio marinus]|uniref:CLUMA_CG006631, isoform A n=1 Tax=Clunio marinus TaxID=568069 RepID=A0A1J1I0L6_9DIPT|nr:CLUMA_CG006631, isoform A [Clunio marinus]
MIDQKFYIPIPFTITRYPRREAKTSNAGNFYFILYKKNSPLLVATATLFISTGFCSISITIGRFLYSHDFTVPKEGEKTLLTRAIHKISEVKSYKTRVDIEVIY